MAQAPEGRELGGVGTKVVFEDHRVRVWVLSLGPGERSPVHRHELDHLLIQVRGDRIAVEPEPDTESAYRKFFEAASSRAWSRTCRKAGSRRP